LPLLDKGFLKQVLRGLFFLNGSWIFCAISVITCTLYWHTNRAVLHKALKKWCEGAEDGHRRSIGGTVTARAASLCQQQQVTAHFGNPP